MIRRAIGRASVDLRRRQQHDRQQRHAADASTATPRADRVATAATAGSTNGSAKASSDEPARRRCRPGGVGERRPRRPRRQERDHDRRRRIGDAAGDIGEAGARRLAASVPGWVVTA